MDHLNLFAPFESRKESHEDVLTRNFLILLKNIPLVQIAFFELIRNFLKEKNIEIESSALGQLTASEIYTQVDSGNPIFSRLSEMKMLSIIISDDIFNTQHQVEESARHARYDGIIISEPSWLFVIENKPWSGNVWENQLDPNIKQNKEIEIIPTACSLSWRNIIQFLNELLANSMLSLFEASAVSDFIEYVDKNYSWLNPYYKFNLCKADKYLLDRRCCAVMESFSETAQVKYHKGWKHYIDVGNDCIKKIALDSETDSLSWKINLWMYAGDIMTAARCTYNAIDIDRLIELSKNDHYSLSPNFHFSYRSTGLMWPDCPLNFFEYIKYWKNRPEIEQKKRPEFESYFKTLLSDNVVSKDSIQEYKEKILSKKYDKLNVCPGFLIKYTWNKNEVERLDNVNSFEEDFKRIINEVFGLFKN